MSERHLVIVGGGLAGLSAGCYARASGYRTTIVEHNLALGGVCAAWRRGPYVVDGCIHWLTGGPFARLYEELGIVPRVELTPLDAWVTWRDAKSGREVTVTRELGLLAAELRAISPEDQGEIERLMEEARRFADMSVGVDRPPEITPLRTQLLAFWEMRGAVGALVHFRKPIAKWAEEHLRSETLRRFFVSLFPEDAPALLLLMVLGYLSRGWLSRPKGGSAAFRDALIGSYERLGGASVLHATVDEILVENGRARGVRLEDGTIVGGDAVISTSSAPETIFRLLDARYDAEATRKRVEDWKMFQPIVLASFGVEDALADVPAMLLADGLAPYTIGDTPSERLYLRVCNDDPTLAPRGHAVIQAMLSADYAFWATRGTDYQHAKEQAAHAALEQIQKVVPQVAGRVRMTDVATPLTYWRQTRSWRGAYEGWTPNAESIFGHVRKTLGTSPALPWRASGSSLEAECRPRSCRAGRRCRSSATTTASASRYRSSSETRSDMHASTEPGPRSPSRPPWDTPRATRRAPAAR